MRLRERGLQEPPASAEAVVDEVMAEGEGLATPEGKTGTLAAEPGELNPLAASKSLGAEGGGENCCH